MKTSKTKLKMFQAVIELIVAAVVFGTSCFAWFASNTQTTAGGMYVQVKCDANLYFYNLVTAVRYYNSGAVLTNIYEIDDGNIRLVAWQFDQNGSKEEQPDQDTDDDFLFSGMLPGEYVDVTLSAYAASETSNGYELCLAEFGTDGAASTDTTAYNTFKFHKTAISESGSDVTTTYGTTVYGILPVFQWGIVTTGSSTVTMNYFHSDYLQEDGNSEKNIFEYYEDESYGISCDSTYSVCICTKDTANVDKDKTGDVTFTSSATGAVEDVTACYSWGDGGKDAYENGKITFRIQTSFDEYYKFLSLKTSDTGTDGDSDNDWDYSNYISNKKITIGSFVLRSKESDSEGGN